MLANKQEQKGFDATVVMKGEVLETTWNGKVDGDAMEGVLGQTRAVMGEKNIRFWFSDTSAVETYTVDMRKPAMQLLHFLKAHGLQEIVGVVPSPAIRMLSTSLTFVVGLKIKMFPTRQEAQDYLSKAGQS